MNIELPESLVQRIQAVAARKGQSPADLLDELLTGLGEPHEEIEVTTPQPGTFAALAKSAREANLQTPTEVDTAIRSREILHREFADYLKSRMERDEDISTD